MTARALSEPGQPERAAQRAYGCARRDRTSLFPSGVAITVGPCAGRPSIRATPGAWARFSHRQFASTTRFRYVNTVVAGPIRDVDRVGGLRILCQDGAPQSSSHLDFARFA